MSKTIDRYGIKVSKKVARKVDKYIEKYGNLKLIIHLEEKP